MFVKHAKEAGAKLIMPSAEASQRTLRQWGKRSAKQGVHTHKSPSRRMVGLFDLGSTEANTRLLQRRRALQQPRRNVVEVPKAVAPAEDFDAFTVAELKDKYDALADILQVCRVKNAWKAPPMKRKEAFHYCVGEHGAASQFVLFVCLYRYSVCFSRFSLYRLVVFSGCLFAHSPL